jgi:hypothetical protein
MNISDAERINQISVDARGKSKKCIKKEGNCYLFSVLISGKS